MFTKRDTDGNLYENQGIYASFFSAATFYADVISEKSGAGVAIEGVTFKDGDISFSGDLSFTGDFAVTGDVEITGGLTVVGNSSFTGSPTYSVLTYGADPTGTNDSYAAITAALAAAADDGQGGVVYMPKGTYLTSAQIQIPNRCWLVGENSFATKLNAISGTFPTSTYMVRLGEGSGIVFNCRVRNINFGCEDITGSGGVYSNEIQEQCCVENCDFNDYTDWAIFFDDGASMVGCEHIACSPSADGSNGGIKFVSVEGTSYIRDCTVAMTAGTHGDGIYVDGGDTHCKNIHIERHTDGIHYDGGATGRIESVYGHSAVTNLVHLDSDVTKIVCSDLNKASGTNILLDDEASETFTDTHIGMYIKPEITGDLKIDQKLGVGTAPTRTLHAYDSTNCIAVVDSGSVFIGQRTLPAGGSKQMHFWSNTQNFVMGRASSSAGDSFQTDFTIDTSGDAEFANDLTVSGLVNVDEINEATLDTGVTIDGVLIKDGEVDGVDVSGIASAYLPIGGGTLTGDLQVNTQILVDDIVEKSAGVGVTIDSVTCWDGGVYFKDIGNDKKVYLYADTTKNYILRLPEAESEGSDEMIVTWSNDTDEIQLDGAEMVGDILITGDLDVDGLLTATDNLTCDSVNHRTYLGLYCGGTPGSGSEGMHCTFVGEYAGYHANQNYGSAFGYAAGYSNTGSYQSAFGFSAGYSNTGSYQSAFGFSAGRSNTGASQSAFGYYAGYSNTGSYQSAFGLRAGYLNTGASQSAFGYYAGRYNDGSSNTAIGYDAFNAFNLDSGSAVSFDYSDVDVGNNRVTVTGHGLGANGTYRNLRFDEGTDTLPGIDDTGIDIWKVIDANTLECITDTITAAGTGTGHTLTPQYVYSNSTAIGYNAEPDASNQIVLGDANVTELKTAAAIVSTSTGTNELDGDLEVGGDLGINCTPSYALSVGSPTGADQVGIYHDDSNAQLRWTDGDLVLVTDEGTNSNTYVKVQGKGTGWGYVRVYDPDNAEYLDLTCYNGLSYIATLGSSPQGLYIQSGAECNVRFFSSSASGETKKVIIDGYRTSDSLRSLEIGVGVDAADTASFDGVSNYLFDGNIECDDLEVTGQLDWSAETSIAYVHSGEYTSTTEGEFWFEDQGGTVYLCLHTNGSTYAVEMPAR